MTGRERIDAVFAGNPPELPPVLPILHSGLPPLFDVPLGKYYTDADTMASVTARGYRTFGFDGVQLSMGVTGEAEALGAEVAQPEHGAPLLREHLLADTARLDALRATDVTRGGRMPLFFDAVAKTVETIGGESFVLATLRGPLIAASQLRGVEQILIDLLESPDEAEQILDFTTDLALRVGTWLRASGAHGLVMGEATCSPNFISPSLYRGMVLARHRRLFHGLREAGWPVLGIHVCGNILPIMDDLISTGVDFMDVDYQVPPERACAVARGRVVLRGNLDPSAVFRFGVPEDVRNETRALCRAVKGERWLLSSGCDIPPGTPAAQLHTFVESAATPAE